MSLISPQKTLPTQTPDETHARIGKAVAENNEFFAQLYPGLSLSNLSVPPLESYDQHPVPSTGDTQRAVAVNYIESSLHDHDSSPSASGSPVDATKIDFDALPSKPDPVIESYNPEFGKEVTLQWYSHRVRDAARRAMYGEEVVETYRHGMTPSPVRRKYWEYHERMERLEELSTDDEGKIKKPVYRGEAKEDISKTGMSEVSLSLNRSPVNKVLAPAADGNKACSHKGSLKRKMRDSNDALGQDLGAHERRELKRRKHN